jgi:hypothetical protein
MAGKVSGKNSFYLARAKFEVERVDAGCRNSDQHVTRPDDRIWVFLEFEDFRAAVGADQNSFHLLYLLFRFENQIILGPKAYR